MKRLSASVQAYIYGGAKHTVNIDMEDTEYAYSDTDRAGNLILQFYPEEERSITIAITPAAVEAWIKELIEFRDGK